MTSIFGQVSFEKNSNLLLFTVQEIQPHEAHRLVLSCLLLFSVWSVVEFGIPENKLKTIDKHVKIIYIIRKELM
jgi:hypothetical protein